jgi:hypothetical protein
MLPLERMGPLLESLRAIHGLVSNMATPMIQLSKEAKS